MVKERHLNFKNCKEAAVQPLILAINLLGKNLVGLELGVFQGTSLLTILNNCHIKKLYGIDSWLAHADFIKPNPDGFPAYSITQEQSDFNKLVTYHRLNHVIDYDKVTIIEEDSLKAVDKIKNESLDFIFFDAMLSEEQSYNEARAYYPKIKKGGLFTGHDSYAIEQVINPIKKIMLQYNNQNELIVYDDCFMFKC
jgi:predicted O-methyltransferase YrrM